MKLKNLKQLFTYMTLFLLIFSSFPLHIVSAEGELDDQRTTSGEWYTVAAEETHLYSDKEYAHPILKLQTGTVLNITEVTEQFAIVKHLDQLLYVPISDVIAKPDFESESSSYDSTLSLEPGTKLTATNEVVESIEVLETIEVPVRKLDEQLIFQIASQEYLSMKVEQPQESEEVVVKTTETKPAPIVVQATSTYTSYFEVVNTTEVYDNSTGKLVVVGFLHAGETFEILRDYGPNWHEIRFGSGKAYVHKKNTKPTNVYPATNLAKSSMVSTGTLEVRQDAIVYDNTRQGQGLVPFATLKGGIEYPFISNFGPNWFQIEINGLIGFVHKDNVRQKFPLEAKYFRVISQNEPVYENVNGQLVVVGYLQQGQTYYRLRDYGPNWHEIQFGNKRVYVHKRNTVVSSSSAVNNLNLSILPGKELIRAREATIVYNNRSGQLVPFFTIEKRAEITYIRDYGPNWYEVQVGNLIGYVKKSLVKRVPPASSPFYEAIQERVQVFDNRSGALIEIGHMKYEDVVLIEADYGPNWYQIQFGSHKAFVRKTDVDRVYGDKIKNVNQTSLPATGYFQTRVEDVPVYDNSSGSLVPFFYLTTNQIYSYVRDFGPNWYEVQIGHRIGYVNKKNLKEVTPQFVSKESLFVYDSYNSAVDWRFQTNQVETLSFGAKVGILQTNGYVAEVITPSGKVGWTYVDHLEESLPSLQWIVRDARNLRSAPSAESAQIGLVDKGTMVTVLDYVVGNDATYRHWYRIRLADGTVGWMWGAQFSGSSIGTVIHIYHNALQATAINNKLTIHTPLKMTSNVTAQEINQYLDFKTRRHLDRSQNTLLGMGDVFIKASQETGVNVMYLVAHAALETGWGTSAIVQDKFNYYGIAAYDRDPYGNAYNFSTKESGIIDGAKWITNNYILRNQDTLNSMRNNNNYHQYATDHAWHIKISNIAKDLEKFVTTIR